MATQGSSIPDLLKTLRASLSKRKFDEVKKMLMDREKKSKIEVQDLKRDLESMKAEARLHERNHSLAELDKLMIEEKLEKTQMIRLELNEKVTSLSEELKASCDREKGAEECHKILSNIITENVQLILELNGKINELQSKNSEINEQFARRKQTEVDNEVEAELKRQTVEANLEEREESQLGSMLNVTLEDLASFAVFTDKFDANGEKVDFPDMIRYWRDSLETDTSNADPENAAIVPRVVCRTSPLVMEGGSHDSSAQDNEASNPPRPASIAVAPPENSAAAQICGKRSGGRKEAKRKRVMAGGEDDGSPYTCKMCGVVCKNITPYISHLSSKKHASKIKKKRVL